MSQPAKKSNRLLDNLIWSPAPSSPRTNEEAQLTRTPPKLRARKFRSPQARARGVVHGGESPLMRGAINRAPGSVVALVALLAWTRVRRTHQWRAADAANDQRHPLHTQKMLPKASIPAENGTALRDGCHAAGRDKCGGGDAGENPLWAPWTAKDLSLVGNLNPLASEVNSAACIPRVGNCGGAWRFPTGFRMRVITQRHLSDWSDTPPINAHHHLRHPWLSKEKQVHSR